MPYTSIVYDSGAILQAAGVGTVSTDIFQGAMPSRVDNNITLYEFQGKKPVRTGGGVVAELGNLKVMVRNSDYETGFAKASAARAALQNYKGTIGSSTYLEITATSSILSLGMDDNGLFKFSVNFQTTRVPQNA